MRNSERLGDKLKPLFAFVLVYVELSEPDLFPTAGLVVVLFDEADWEGVKLRIALAVQIPLSSEIPDVEENGDEEIERGEGLLLDQEATIAVRCVTALYLDANLLCLRLSTGVRMDADQVLAFVVRRGFVGKDIPPHEIALNQEFRPV